MLVSGMPAWMAVITAAGTAIRARSRATCSHSLVLACLMGGLIMLQAYVPSFTGS
jgi:hypothetical protein